MTITPGYTLDYHAYENGDRIPDYSYCGYKASEESIPNHVEARIKVSRMEGDATGRIQRAIDYVNSLPMDASGFRGAVLLEKGSYRIDGALQMTALGVILRGSGSGEDDTVLIGSGTDRATLIRLVGRNDQVITDSIPVGNQYIPVNATRIPMHENHPLKSGDKILVTRPSTAEWIKEIGVDKIGIYVDYQLTHWEPRDFDLQWERTVLSTSSHSVTIEQRSI